MTTRRFFVSLVIVNCLLPLTVFGQSTPNRPFEFKVEDTTMVFKSLFDAKSPRGKDAFETEDEYRQRSQNRLDPNKIYYVKVERKSILGTAMDDMYSYKIDSGDLTVYAGDYVTERIDKSATFKTVPFCVRTDDRSGGEYEASNAFGAKATVKKSYVDNYVLNIVNCKEFDSKFVDFRKHRIGVGVKIADRDEAKRLSRSDGEVIIGFRISNIPDSKVWEDYDRPTFRDPYETFTTRYSIVARLEKIILVDRKNGSVVGWVDAKPK